AARNIARPAIPAVQLFQRLSGRITSEAPLMARMMRKASQLRRSRRRLRILGTSSTSAKRALRPRLRSRVATDSCWGAMGVEVVPITLLAGTANCFSICAGKRQNQFFKAQRRPTLINRGWGTLRSAPGGKIKSNSWPISLERVFMSGIFEGVDFAHARESAADVRDGDGAADDEGN